MKARNRYAILIATTITITAIFLLAASDDELKPVPEKLKAGFESITEADSMNYLAFLSADELEGRDTPSRGQRIARGYIASLYKLWGVAPAGDGEGDKKSYEQRIPVVIVEPGADNRLEVRSGNVTRLFQYGIDFFPGRRSSFDGSIEAPVVFAGYGISAPELGYDDLAGLDLKGKIVVYMSGVPGDDNKESPFANPEVRRKYSGFGGTYDKDAVLKERGAIAVANVMLPMQREGDFEAPRRPWGPYKRDNYIESPDKEVSSPDLEALGDSLPGFMISERAADCILSGKNTTLAEIKKEIDTSLKPKSAAVDGLTIRIFVETKMTPNETANVLGIIEGSDPELKHEYIVIGAHLDHMGMTEDGYVFNGADDNASGSVGVIELAQAFALNPVKPKRSIIFAHWTGEEKGLIGSRYFAEFPTVPFDKIVACLNLDMISRSWSAEQLERMARRFGETLGGMKPTPEMAAKLFTVSLSAQSPDLNTIITEANKNYVGFMLFSRPSAQMSGGSDHAPFHQKKVPSVFFFSAMHEDYHQPSDTIDKVSGERMAKIIRLVYLTAYEVADMPERLPWKEE
jgi:hypothetical protein